MLPALKGAIEQEIAFFTEIKKRLDLLAQRPSVTSKQIHAELSGVYAQAYSFLQKYMQDLQQLTDAMQGLVAPTQEQAQMLQAVPLEKRNAVLYSLAVLRASERPSLQFRIALLQAKASILQALVSVNPQQAGVTNEKYHADLEQYGKFLIDFDECFLAQAEQTVEGLPWVSLGAGLIGGYTLKEVMGEKGFMDLFSTFFGADSKDAKKGDKQKSTS